METVQACRYLNGSLPSLGGELEDILVCGNAVDGLFLLAGRQKGATGQNS